MKKGMGDIENLPNDVGQLKHLIWDYYQQINHLQDRVALLQLPCMLPSPKNPKISSRASCLCP